MAYVNDRPTLESLDIGDSGVFNDAADWLALGGKVDLAGIYHALRPSDATAWLLLGVVVVIVIAPSVDLEPTILRVTHLSGISLLLVAAATMASLLPTILASRFHHPWYTISSTNDLVVLVCARRC